MASNFVDDIKDDSADKYSIATSYVIVFKPRCPSPRLNSYQTNSLTQLDDIDFNSRFCMKLNKQCFCNLLDKTEL